MKGILLIAGRDLRAYFDTAWGYVVTAALLLVNGLLFNAFAMGSTARYSSDVIEDFFYYSSGTVMIAAIILTMRLFAEERSQGTLVLLDTAPASDLSIVIGKYLAGMSMMAITVGLTIYMPLLVMVNGKVSVGHICSGYLGLLLLASAVVAIGTWGSSLAKTQYVAGAVAGFVVVVLLLAWLLAKVSDPPFKDVVSYLSLFDRHFQPFMRGRINTESVLFYASITFAFLFLTVRGLEGRRWK